MSTDAGPAGVGEFSAGGVVVDGDRVVVIVPVKRAADGRRVLGLPKGHLDGDETPEQAATREVAEETGVDGELIDELGDVRYRLRAPGTADREGGPLLPVPRTASGDLADHDHEIEEARLDAAGAGGPRAHLRRASGRWSRRAMSRTAPDR